MSDRRLSADETERVVIPLVQMYATEILPSGIFWRGGLMESHIDLITRNLVLTLKAYCMGDEGPSLGQDYVWYEYTFPWYVPRWLRNRWRKRQVISTHWQGRVIYPEARIIPDLGTGRRVVEFYQYGPTPGGDDE